MNVLHVVLYLGVGLSVALAVVPFVAWDYGRFDSDPDVMAYLAVGMAVLLWPLYLVLALLLIPVGLGWFLLKGLRG